MDQQLRIGEVSEQAGVTTRTIRYYESIGLLPFDPRKVGAHRSYTTATVTRLRKIEQLKVLGLSLEEIASVIDLYFEDPSGRQAKLGVLAILRRHLADARGKVDALQQFCADLELHIARFELWLANPGAGHERRD